MTYDEAVAYVLREKAAAYTFLPEERHGKVVGGKAYLIAYDEQFETDPDEYFEYNVYYSGGLFRSSSGEGDVFGPSDVPKEAWLADYLPADPSAVDAQEYVLELFLLCLKGMPKEEAQQKFDRMTIEQILSY